MRHLTIFLFILIVGVLLLTGCQESDASQIRRARLVANENLQLKQDLEDKEQQIENLKKQIEEIEAKNAEEHEKFGNTTLKTLQMLSETEIRNQALTLENEKLKEELEKIKAQ
jgi:hypothetical protein